MRKIGLLCIVLFVLLLQGAVGQPVLRLKIALIGDPEATSFEWAREILSGHSMQFDEIPFLTRTADSKIVSLGEGILNGLRGPTGECRYSALIMSNSEIGDSNGNDIVTDAMRQRIDDYLATCDVRMVYLFEFPRPSLGHQTNQVGIVTSFNVTFTPFGASLAHSIIPNTISVNSTFRFLASPAPPPVPATQVLLRYGTGEVAAILAGANTMVFFFDQTPLLSGAVLGHYWFDWVTKNMFVGIKRFLLNMHVDDLFLSTNVWQPQLSARFPNVTYRCTDQDLTLLKEWQDASRAILPEGTNLRVLMAINGAGVGLFSKVDLLFNKAVELLNDFLWCSHTYSHLNLDRVSFQSARFEILENIKVAGKLFKGVPPKYWSVQGMVTPQISGLFNGEALRGLYESGIRAVSGDNTRDEIVNFENQMWPLISTEAENGFDGIYIIPRFATDVYYDVSLPVESEAEYTVLKNLSRPLPLGTFLDLDTKFAAVQVVKLRHDAYMFHQANLRFFDVNLTNATTSTSPKTCLLCEWGNRVINVLSKYIAMPVYSTSPDQDYILFRNRMIRDKCDATVTVVRQFGAPTSLTVSATSPPCEIPVSGLFGGNHPLGRTVASQNPGVLRYEAYGSRTGTLWVNLTSAQAPPVTVSLNPAITVFALPSNSPNPSLFPLPDPAFSPNPNNNGSSPSLARIENFENGTVVNLTLTLSIVTYDSNGVRRTEGGDVFVASFEWLGLQTSLQDYRKTEEEALRPTGPGRRTEESAPVHNDGRALGQNDLLHARRIAAQSERDHDGNNMGAADVGLSLDLKLPRETFNFDVDASARISDATTTGDVDLSSPASSPSSSSSLPSSEVYVSEGPGRKALRFVPGQPSIDLIDHKDGTYSMILSNPSIYGSWALSLFVYARGVTLEVPGNPRLMTIVGPPPVIVSFTAFNDLLKEPKKGYRSGDWVEIEFDGPTDLPLVSTKDDVDILIEFSHPIGLNYTAVWSTSSILRVEITEAAAEAPPIGKCIATPVKPQRATRGGIRRTGGVSGAALRASPPLKGRFSPEGPQCLACWVVPLVIIIAVLAILVVAYDCYRYRKKKRLLDTAKKSDGSRFGRSQGQDDDDYNDDDGSEESDNRNSKKGKKGSHVDPFALAAKDRKDDGAKHRSQQAAAAGGGKKVSASNSVSTAPSGKAKGNGGNSNANAKHSKGHGLPSLAPVSEGFMDELDVTSSSSSSELSVYGEEKDAGNKLHRGNARERIIYLGSDSGSSASSDGSTNTSTSSSSS